MDRLPVTAYERAERMLGHHRHRLVLHSRANPNWIGDGRTFWYAADTERGTEYVVVDPEAGTREPAFDHERLAAALADASGEEVAPYELPIEALEFGDREIRFDAFDVRWSISTESYECRRDGAVRSPLEVPSPDGSWVAFRRGHDLWVRSVESGDEFALSTDGTADQPYACAPDSGTNWRLLNTIGVHEPAPVLVWSPDSRRILTHRLDQRGVPLMHLVEAVPPGGDRPRLHSYHYPTPGDPLAGGEWLVFDIHARTTARAAGTFLVATFSPITRKRAWWSADSGTVYVIDQPRDLHTLRLNAIDATTGAVRTLIEESGETRVEPAQEILQRPIVHVLDGGREALWYSQRDGWGHLYLYDAESGQLSAKITKGRFTVQDILYVDDAARVAYLTVSGLVEEDPYRRSLVSVGLDGGDLTRLTDDEPDHVLVAPPHGRWFVDSASTVDTPPVITVRGRDGSVLVELERADEGRLLEAGWTAPERISTTAADGETVVYGVLYKPFGFDPDQRYPVVDHPYPGPQIHRSQPSFDCGRYGYDAEAVAALGFAVLVLDGRGTPGRDKEFHDYSYRNMGSAGALEDHVAALHELAGTRPWLDLDRVGVFGLSGGGFATVRAMLAFPETYKVGVAEAGNHDNRYYHALWAETYDGPYDPDAGARLSNTELAADLAGKLLLVHGEMDDNVTPHLTMRLVDELIRANKDFDLLVVPGAEHSFTGYQDYVTRRRWDYLVRHLLGAEPPRYRLAPIPLSPDLRAFLFR